MIDIKYKRAFLKLSGEALALKGEDGSVKEIFDDKVIDDIAEDICACTELGAEIGISTQKLGPRGPMALEEITTYKWLIEGNGQTRP